MLLICSSKEKWSLPDTDHSTSHLCAQCDYHEFPIPVRLVFRAYRYLTEVGQGAEPMLFLILWMGVVSTSCLARGEVYHI